MQDSERLSRDEILALYKDDVARLLRYLPWLQKVSGTDTSQIRKGEGIEATTMPVPVYDSTLLAFIKEVKSTQFINRNYVYTFSRNRLRTAQDELDFIATATLRETAALGDILSQYVLKGDTQGVYWSLGVRNGVYLALIEKLRDFYETYIRLNQ